MKLSLPFVAWQNEDGVALLGFADDQFNTTQYLVLQRTVDATNQDRVLGQDKVYIQLNERSAYGDVQEAQLEEGRLVLRLDHATAAQIGNGETIEVEFSRLTNLNSIASQLQLLIGSEHIRLVGGRKPGRD